MEYSTNNDESKIIVMATYDVVCIRLLEFEVLGVSGEEK